MESHEEKLHKLVRQSKINEAKDVLKEKTSKIDKSKIEKSRGDKGGFKALRSMGSGGIGSAFGEMNISCSGGGFSNNSGYPLIKESDFFSSKPKGHPPAAANAPPKGPCS